MPGPRFVFHHEWVLDAPRDAVVAALADIEGYPRWWPQIRSLERIDETSGRGRIRSALPLTLHLVLTREKDLMANYQDMLRSFGGKAQ